MAINWKPVNESNGHLQVGVDWNYTSNQTSVTYAPIVYFWYKENSGDPHVNYSWNLTDNGGGVTSGSSVLNVGNFQGQGKVDSFTSRTTYKNKTAKNLALKLDFSDLYGGWGQSWTGSWSGTWTLQVDPITSYTISYNANGGSGAPGNQKKWHGEDLAISSVKPTKSGYTFKGWSLTKGGTVYYTSGSTCGRNENLTLWAVWEENVLTVNYYSNYATSSFAGALNAVGSDKNVIVRTAKYFYDNDYTTYGLDNYSTSSGAVFMARIGYTATGKWGSSVSGGTLVDEDTKFASGQAIAQAFGKSLANGNATINLYAQWRENVLTVRYHSNHATNAFVGTENPVSADKDVVVRTHGFKYATAIPNGLHNYSKVNDSTYLARTRYDALGYWGTAPEIEIGKSTNQIITTANGIAVHEDCTAFKNGNTGRELADVLGVLRAFESGDTSIDLYAQWVLLASRVTVYLQDGNSVRGLVHIYDDNGELHYGIVTVYGQDGSAHTVV